MITRDNYEIYFIDYLDGKLSDDDTFLLMTFLDDNPDLKEELEDIGSFKLDKPEISYVNKDDLKILPELPAINLDNFQDYLTKDLEEGLTRNEYADLEKFSARHPEVYAYIRANDLITLKPQSFIYRYKASVLKLSSGMSLEDASIGYIEGDLSYEETRALQDLVNQSPGAADYLQSYQKTKLVSNDIEYTNKKSLYQRSGGMVISLWTRWAAVAAVVVFGFFLFRSNEDPRYQTRNGKIFQTAEIDNSVDFTIDSADVSPVPLSETKSVTVQGIPQKKYDPQYKPEPGPLNVPKEPIVEEDFAMTPLEPVQTSKDSILEIKPLKITESSEMMIAREETSEMDEKGRLEPMTLRAYTLKKANELVKDNPHEYEDNATGIAVAGIGKVLKTEADYARAEVEERKVTSLSIGRFSYYHSKKK